MGPGSIVFIAFTITGTDCYFKQQEYQRKAFKVDFERGNYSRMQTLATDCADAQCKLINLNNLWRKMCLSGFDQVQADGLSIQRRSGR